MTPSKRWMTAALPALLSLVSVCAQDAEEVVKVDTALVTVNVSVTDAKGRRRPGLLAENFLVTDEGQPVSLEFFESQGPASLVFLIDTSASMKGQKWQNLKDGLRKFLANAHAGNDYTLISFDDRPRLIVSRVSAGELWEGFNVLSPSGQTALYDAVLLGLSALERAPQRHKALVLLSDGADTCSYAGLPRVQQEVLAYRAAMYTVGILIHAGYVPPSERDGHELLRQLADATGGLVHFPEPNEIRKALETINADLSGQYTLSYYPPSKAPGWRRVQVSVAPEPGQLKLRYQQRYLLK